MHSHHKQLPRLRDGGCLQDQASGLRRLLAPQGAPTVVFFGGRGGIGTTTIAAGCGMALSQCGCSVVIVDERGGARGVASVLDVRTRYDLLQAVEGHVALHQVALNVNERLSVLPAARAARRLVTEERGDRAAWAACIDTIRRGWEFVLVDGAVSSARSLSRLALAADEFVIIVGREPTSLTESYALIKRIARTCPSAKVGIVVAKTRDEDEARAAFENLGEVAAEHLGLRLNLLGCVPFDPEWRAMRTLEVLALGGSAAQTCTQIAAALKPEQGEERGEFSCAALGGAARRSAKRAPEFASDQIQNTNQEQSVDARTASILNAIDIV